VIIVATLLEQINGQLERVGYKKLFAKSRLGMMSAVTKKLQLPPDFAKTLNALLRTPPPPAGDPSTRKQKPKTKRPAKRKAR
jgi:hypothetical protein